MARFEQDFLISYDDQSLVSELRRLAGELKKEGLSRTDIDEYGRVSSGTVIKRFGSLRKAMQAAGLRSSRFTKASDGELLGILIELWTRTLEKEGRRPFKKDLKAYGFPVSPATFVRRYESWKAALLRAVESVKDQVSVQDEVPGSQSDQTGRISKRGSLSVRKRFLIFKRDRYRCRICRATGVELEVDHIAPVDKGGSDALDNLQTLCFNCNRGKRDSIQ